MHFVVFHFIDTCWRRLQAVLRVLCVCALFSLPLLCTASVSVYMHWQPHTYVWTCSCHELAAKHTGMTAHTNSQLESLMLRTCNTDTQHTYFCAFDRNLRPNPIPWLQHKSRDRHGPLPCTSHQCRSHTNIRPMSAWQYITTQCWMPDQDQHYHAGL